MIICTRQLVILTFLSNAQMARQVSVEMCLSIALLFPSADTFCAVFVPGLQPGCSVPLAIFTSGQLKAPLRCQAGALGCCAFGPQSVTLLSWREKERAALTSPAHPQTRSVFTYIPTCSIPQKSFQVLFEREKSRRGRNQSLCSSSRSISRHCSPLCSQDTTLLPSPLVFRFFSLYFSFSPFYLFFLMTWSSV